MKPSTFTIPCPFGEDTCEQSLTIIITPERPAVCHNFGWDFREPAELFASGCAHVDDVSHDDWPELEARLWKIVWEREEEARAAQADQREEV